MALTGRGKLPRSNATNAYDLLGDVITAIQQEPKRLNMSTWLEVTAARIATLKNTVYGDHDRTYTHAGAPSCGTVGCIAGWVETLKRSGRQTEMFGDTVESQAQNRLRGGTCPVQGYDRLWETAVHQLFHTFPAHRAGTRVYAKAVVNAIERFRLVHLIRLKATSV